MNNQRFLILVLLCGLAACMSFRWVYTDFNYTGKTITHMPYQRTSDGTIYAAYEDKVYGLNITIWEAIGKGGNINIKSIVDERNTSRGFAGMAIQISSNARHLLAAFFGCYNERLLHDLEGSVKDCASVYFIESVDGGARWSTPVQVSESRIYIPPRSSISLVLERDTGRVYLFHAIKASESASNSQIVVYVREPNERSFKNMNTLVNLQNLGPFTALVTGYGSGGTGYVHLIMAINGNIVHSRSSNRGMTWSAHKQIAQGVTPYNSNYVIYDLEYHRSYFELIYRKENDRRVYSIWTNDHGDSFQSPTLVGDSPRPNQETIGVCGSSESVAIVSHTDPDPRNIFIKVQIGNSPFTDLPNPFAGIRGAPIANLMVGCAYRGYGEYHITFHMLTRADTDRRYVAFGILNVD